MSMSVEKWLALPDDKLPIELGKVFTPEPWKHDWISDSIQTTCKRCKGPLDCTDTPEDCPVPDPIKLDCWNVAKYWQGKCNPFAFREWLWQIWASQPERKGSFVEWVISIAQPADYLRAAAMVLERSKE